MTIKKSFGSVITAMVTPFRGNDKKQIDLDSVASLVTHLTQTGTDSLLLTGSTGEAPQLSESEKDEVISFVREITPKETPLIVSVGSNNTDTVHNRALQASNLGADAILISVPEYIKPPQRDLFRHFNSVAKSFPKIPIIIYNIPCRTGTEILPKTVARLAQENANIIGIKQSMGNMERISEMKILCPPDFQIYSGDDSLTLPMMALGATGVISVTSHLEGRLIQDMIEKFKTGNPNEATQIHQLLYPLIRTLFMTTNPIPVKEALYQRGIIKSPVLRTLSRMGRADQGKFVKELKRFNDQKKAYMLSHKNYSRERS